MSLAKLNEPLTFISKFVQSPRQVGSIAPSSRFLAAKMLAPIDWKNTSIVAELGAGTGALTKYIHMFKQPDCKLFAFEKDQQMRDRIQSSYPGTVCFADALDLKEHLYSRLNAMEAPDVIVSGLPFALFEKRMRECIVEQAADVLKPDGIFIAFQYSLQMKKLLINKFSRVDISFVSLNIPPAFMYVCHK
ncbi:class I SAM-dependent methyltransferase [Thermoactinomyces mirandus]|uniref:Phospholipid methyltransferase n=1 Tax=Thermoactinomyces mirandus TaxID=2756294 RepID=A0A7W1XTQ6_9BACL|nr:methyltransferase [Thermoactinomyces mirandus]MBA4603084.1 phospholipid methyltransferase [Thermoactinomyces mirandus]